ncbi:MAG: DUF4810 domain-containing protein [Sideroxyarcus sp.]
MILPLFFVLAGCQHAPANMYQWGSYEQQLYVMYFDPGNVPVVKQLEDLEQDYQKVRAANGTVPPGFHAHLGYLYFQSGKTDQALQSFATEKTLFPESAVYMDRLIARLKK